MKFSTLYFILLLLTFISPSYPLLYEENIGRKTIELNNDWEFNLKGQNSMKINIPHDYSIIQKFNERCEGESGFLPGGTAFYKKTFVEKRDTPFSSILYFNGVYKDCYITINGKQIGENHYGYNSFSFDISQYLVLDGQKENVIEVRVEHDLPSSRWYSGSGIFRGVYLLLTDKLHIANEGLKVTTPDISTGKGTVKVQTSVINSDDTDSKIKLNINIKRNGEIVANTLSEEQTILKGEIKELSETLVVEKPELWNDKHPNLYLVEVEMIKDDTVIDRYSTKFGFRYFIFNKEKGFIINGVPTKLHGVSLHHDYGALGSIDNYDAAYKRLTQLKEMGINSIRTTHNIPYRTWIDICDEIGLYVIEEFFDGWNYNKSQNSNDFSKYFNVLIEGGNSILGGNGLTWAEFALKSAIRRDRNCPSIILWSIGNEVGSYSKIDGNSPNIAKDLIRHGKELDDSRPYTRGDNEYWTNDGNQLGINQAIVDSGGIIGYNYANDGSLQGWANRYGAIYLSESASALNSRSVYSLIDNGGKTQKHDGSYHLTSYDTSFPSWANTAHYYLWVTLSKDFVAGQYVWTGFDYLGEPTPWNGDTAGSRTGKGAIPNSAYFGIIDTCGFPKDSYYLYTSQLRRDLTTVHLVTAWDKNNLLFVEGSKTPVHLYSNAPKIELFRDDKDNVICTSIRKNVKTNAGYEYYTYEVKSNDNICNAIGPDNNDRGTDLFSRFNIEFKQGTKLYTKAYDEEGNLIKDSEIIGNHFMKAPNLDKLKLEVKVDKNEIIANGKSLAYVEVSIIDEDGILNTKGNNLIIFALEGQGKILGVDNGDQATLDKYQQESVLKGDNSASIRAYAGKALAIISSTTEEGTIKIKVSSEKYNDVDIEINTKSE